MAVEAATSVTQAYDKIRQDGISTDLCKDVTAYTFPDMCMPNADYAGEYPSVTENPDGTSTTSTQKYDDTRPKDGKNTPKDLKFNEAFKINTGAYLGYKIQPKTPQTLKVKTEMCAAVAAGTAFDRNAKGDTIARACFHNVLAVLWWPRNGFVCTISCIHKTPMLVRWIRSKISTLVCSRRNWAERLCYGA